MRRIHIKSETVWQVCSALLLLVLLTVRLTVGMSARYTGTSTGTSSATVARFCFDVTANDSPVDVRYDGTVTDPTAVTDSYTVTVKNYTADDEVCEVTLKYRVVVTFPEKPIESLSLSMNGTSGTVQENGKVYIFEGKQNLPAGVKTEVTETLVFSVDFDQMKTDHFFDEMTISYTGNNPACIYGNYHLGGITVSAVAEQID